MRKFRLNVKHNFVLVMAAALTALCLSICLVACNNKTKLCDEHSFGDWETVSAATCTAEGTKAKICSVCGFKETEKIPMIDHSFGEWQPVKEATCTEAGTKSRKCSVCQHEETDSLPIIEHSFGDWQTVKEATCTAGGSRKRICKNCSHSETEDTDPTGHSYDADDVCTSCGDIEGYLFFYDVETETYTLLQYSGTKTSIRLPSRHLGKAVTHIGESAFTNNATLTTVIIPDGIVSIGKQAFYNCANLTTLTIPDSVTNIGNMAFDRCTALETVSLPTLAIKFISKLALKNVTITSGDSVEGSAFSGCTLLSSVTLHENLTSIGDRAFEGCESLEQLSIPDSVTRIDDGAFNGTAWYQKQPDGLVYAGKVAYTYKGEMQDGTSITLKVGTIGIAGKAFSGCTNLTGIAIPNTVTNIGGWAFSGCTGLTSVEIPTSVTYIGEFAFENCTGLTEVTIPSNLKNIEWGTFSGCTNLKTVHLPISVKSIGDSAFKGCTSLTLITYEGTTDEWIILLKDNDWNSGTGNYTVHCENGNLDKDDEEI